MSRTLKDLYADRKRVQAIYDREYELPKCDQNWELMHRCSDRIEILSAYIIYAEEGGRKHHDDSVRVYGLPT